eukprot:CAMPEP_0179292602 /NCGR_PEP_ID=MMETSP0797-20121207/42938_1 /TAXON_ID=47934 /ORGANISM="Dinophysis acuminata, Strain DAEP01" /LENGTH=463 /DNA_ID=CAMNT_0021001715 /DNA_START=9 /DNA_END=1400 /DNA_ORIENTATION=-
MVRLLPLCALPLAAGAISLADLQRIAGGIVEGFLPNQTQVKRCIRETDNALRDVERAVRDLERETASAVSDGLQELASAMQDLPGSLAPCRAPADKARRLADALEQLRSPSEFVFNTAHDIVVNGHNLYGKLAGALADYAAEQLEEFGVQLGEALRQLGAGVEELFTEFEERFERKWRTGEEREAAKRAFAENLLAIRRSNDADDGSAVYSHATPFADVPAEEFSRRNGRRPRAGVEVPAAASSLDPARLPASWDWRAEGAVNGVRDQCGDGRRERGCGSCWAFAAVANIEGVAFVNSQVLPALREQEPADDPRRPGGLPDVYDDVARSGRGLEVEGYGGGRRAFITGWQRIARDEGLIAAALVKRGPLAIGINAGPMQWYHHGVADPWDAACDPATLDHGAALVGYGASGAHKYWLIRNSWGADWGERGYYRIVRGANKCGLANMVTTAIGVMILGPRPVVV